MLIKFNRMKSLVKTTTIALFAFAVTNGSFAQAPVPAQVPEVTTQKLTDRIYTVETGVGARTGFVVGDKGVLIIDATSNADGMKIFLAEIAKVTPLPVTTVILTHSDPDHVGGLVALPKDIQIIAHAQTKTEMERQYDTPESSAILDYLPGTTFTEIMDYTFGPERMQLMYLPHAHTSGDIAVVFPEEKLAFTGDVIMPQDNPVMHPDKGSDTDDLIRSLTFLRSLNVDLYVTGHSGVVDKSAITDEISHIEKVKAEVASLVKEGKTLDEVKTALGVVEPDSGGYRFASLPEIIYNELMMRQ